MTQYGPTFIAGCRPERINSRTLDLDRLKRWAAWRVLSRTGATISPASKKVQVGVKVGEKVGVIEGFKVGGYVNSGTGKCNG